MARGVWLTIAVGLSVVAACTSDGERERAPDAADDLPPPVSVRAEPEGVSLADPAFTALPGAQAEYGRLHGAVYEVEIPDDWNHQLVLFMEGFAEFNPEARVGPPDIRAQLIARGFAWGVSSLSGTGWIPGRAALETAALWDHFARAHARPIRTYVIGESMGGAAANLAAERFPERFDGVLALCGSAGATSGLGTLANVFVAGAYAAGVTQDDYDATTDIAALINDRIRPALDDPERRDVFERVAIDLTGGDRPFGREGLRLEEETLWRRAALAVGTGVVPRRSQPYELGADAGISSSTFEESALRLRTDDDALDAFIADNDPSGDLRVPLLTLHATGDGQVAVGEAGTLQRLVDRAGASELLVQRLIRDGGHCGFTSREQAASFDDLVEWVEHHVRPDGHDVLAGDFTDLHPAFELQPRPGTPESTAVPGARDRVHVHGTATIDGRPLDARFFGAAVVRDGLAAACQLELASARHGVFDIVVVADTELAGCGTRDADIVFWTYQDGLPQLNSTAAVPWPTSSDVDVEVTFSSTRPFGATTERTGFVGDVLDATGRYAAPGTLVEAFVGDTLCGRTAIRSTGNFSGYTIAVAGPDAVPGCIEGGAITFLVDGHEAAQTATNDVGSAHSPFDLTMP